MNIKTSSPKNEGIGFQIRRGFFPRRYFVLIGVLTVFFCLRSYAAGPTATTPVAWFKANDLTSGPVSLWPDASGNGNNATQPSASKQPAFVSSSPINGKPAVRFDGVNDLLAFARVVQDDFTIAVVFFSAGGVANGNQWYDVSGVVDAEVSGVTNDFGISFTTDGRVLAGTGNPDVTVSSAPGFNSQAHAAVFRRTKTTGAIQLFIDGVLVNSKVGGTQTLNAPSRMVLGSLQPDIAPFPGDIAEVLVYATALSDAENVELQAYLATKYGSVMTCVPSPSGIEVWFPGDGYSSDIRGGLNGTLKNGATFAPGKVRQAFSFDGVDDFVEVPDAPALTPPNGITLAAWVFRTTQNAGDIISKDGEGFARQYILNVGQNNKFRAHVGVPGGLMFVESTSTAPLNTWTHVAMTYDGNNLNLYVNGLLEGSVGVTGPISQGTQPVRIGGGAPTGYPQFFFAGSIDEVQIYDRALAQDEIGTIVNSGGAGTCRFTPDLWVAGRDLVFNEKPDNAAESNPHNTVVPEWSYGTRAQAATTELNLFPAGLHVNNANGFEGWDSSGTVEGALGVNVNSTPLVFASGVKALLTHQLVLHPGADNRFAVVRWTAPADGSYRVLAEWLDLDARNGNGASAHVVINGIERFGKEVPADQVGPKRFVGQEWENGGNAEMPAETFKLKAGDVIDFAVGSRGSYFSDTTAFNAIVRRVADLEITNAPPQSKTEEGITLPEGSDVTLEVEVQSPKPIVEVFLLVNGRETVSDTTPPYSLTATNLAPGFYSILAVATDEEGMVSGSELINVNVEAIPAAAAQTNAGGTKGSSAEPASANSAGRTFTCTQSGAWGDPATWGGQGVPGRNDYAVIPSAFAVNAGNVEVDDLSLFGTLVIGSPGFPRHFVVYDKFFAAGTAQGGDASSQLVVYNAMDCIASAARFRDLSLFVSGESVVTNKGAIDAANCVLELNGRLKIYSPPGTNKPATVRVGEAKIAGTVAIDKYGQLIGPNGVIARDGASIIGNDSAGLVSDHGLGILSDAGVGLIGDAGSGILGVRGTPLIGMDSATLIGNDGNTLIGNDGASIISEQGGGIHDGRPASGADVVARQTGAGEVVLEGATLGGNINVIGNLVNQGGYVSPGNSAGKITVSGNYTQAPGGTLVLEIGGTQTSPLQFDQLQVNGAANFGGNLIVKTIDGFTPQAGDTFSPLIYSSASGSFATVTSNAQISFGGNGMTMQVNGPNPPAPKALNIATRMKVETGDNALIAGFIITGSQPKKVIVRGIGPSLPFGGVLADPTLSLDNGAVTNDNWRSNQEQEIIATTIPPASNLESAIVATLSPGPHTAILRGSGNSTGIGVVEVYDLDSGSPVQLANISSRGFVQAGDNVMIGGFIIGGTYPAKVIVRAIGPSLPFAGKLEDPTLELVNQNGGRMTNDDWRATQAAEIIGTTIPPTHDKEAAIVATLAPGNYTAVVRGKDDTTGIAVVEAYNLQ